MEDYTWWEHAGLTILRADYSNVEDPIRFLRDIQRIQQACTDKICYSLIDFGFRRYSKEFIAEYEKVAKEFVLSKKAVSAYMGLLPEYHSAARQIISKVNDNVRIEFFDTETAAIEWLVSFRREHNE